jgi:hypothetical protein
MKKITDLEKFSLEEVWWPYQTMEPHCFEERLTNPPFDLLKTAELLRIKNEWTECVLSRIYAVGVYFPDYIRHPLVDVIQGDRRVRMAMVSDCRCKCDENEASIEYADEMRRSGRLQDAIDMARELDKGPYVDLERS